MNKHIFGEIFKTETPRSSRPSRSTAQYRQSYNEDLIAPSIGKRDEGNANVSTFSCVTFMTDAGINEDFLTLVNNAGLTTYMNDLINQYSRLTKIFAESFTFDDSIYKPSVKFRIYGMPITMPLSNFCDILGVRNTGTSRKIQDKPTDLLALYREVTNDDTRAAQHGKIRNIQLPAIRYFVYYLATSILGRENTSNVSNYHLAFLAAARNNSTKYNLGAVIACRLATSGPIYGGFIASRILAALEILVDPNDELLVPESLDLAAMKGHQFVTANSFIGGLVYRMVFADGEEREVPLPQPNLFSICRKLWSHSKEELDEQLNLSEFYGLHQGEEEAVDNYAGQYTGASSSSYQDEGASSAYF